MNVDAAENIVKTAQADPQTTLRAIGRWVEYGEVDASYEMALIDYELKANDHPAWEEVVEVLTEAIANTPPCRNCAL